MVGTLEIARWLSSSTAVQCTLFGLHWRGWQDGQPINSPPRLLVQKGLFVLFCPFMVNNLLTWPLAPGWSQGYDFCLQTGCSVGRILPDVFEFFIVVTFVESGNVSLRGILPESPVTYEPDILNIRFYPNIMVFWRKFRFTFTKQWNSG